MFRIDDDQTIHLTRGDIATITFKPTDDAGNPHTLKNGDVVRFQAYEKKNHSNVVLSKEVKITGDCTAVDISLNKNDTKIGGIIDKPKDYWWEIEINPDTAPQTAIGYDDENGAKVLKLYPEGGD